MVCVCVCERVSGRDDGVCACMYGHLVLNECGVPASNELDTWYFIGPDAGERSGVSVRVSKRAAYE